MKDVRRANAQRRNAVHAELSTEQKIAKAMKAPGNAEQELRRLYARWLIEKKSYPDEATCRSYVLGLDVSQIRERCRSILENA